MLSLSQLEELASARLADADALYRAQRFDGAVYLVGYVVELRLKRRICLSLEWPGFPEKRSEFEGLQSFKTHDLDVLLRLSGRERYVKQSLFAEWSIATQWNPEGRYRPVGSVSQLDAQQMIEAAKALASQL